MGTLGPTMRMADVHKRFAHFLAGRSDWLAVYVLAQGPDFKRLSRLPWDVLLKFTDHAGRKCQLLRLRQALVRPVYSPTGASFGSKAPHSRLTTKQSLMGIHPKKK